MLFWRTRSLYISTHQSALEADSTADRQEVLFWMIYEDDNVIFHFSSFLVRGEEELRIVHALCISRHSLDFFSW